MPRKQGKASPEGNGPVPQKDGFGSDQHVLADLYRMMEELFDKSDWKLDKLTEEMRGTRSCLASLKQEDVRQPRLAMEEDFSTDTKTRKRTEDATADQEVKHGDSCSANQIDPDPTCLTSFGDDFIGPLALPCSRDNALADKDVAAPKLCLSQSEMRTLTAAGGLLPIGKAPTATMTIFYQRHFLFCLT